MIHYNLLDELSNSNWTQSPFCCGLGEIYNGAHQLLPGEVKEFTTVVKKKNNNRTGLLTYVGANTPEETIQAFLDEGWTLMAKWRSNHNTYNLHLFGLIVKGPI